MHHYWITYVAVGCLALVPFISFLVLNSGAWLASRRENKERQKQLQALSSGDTGAATRPERDYAPWAQTVVATGNYSSRF
jgi:hypothetical protein